MWAAAASGRLWALFHSGAASLGVVVQLALFDFVLAFVYERTGSLWPTIGIHAANNAIAFAILAW